MLKQIHNPYVLACHLKIDVDPDPVPDPVYYCDANSDPDFYLMRIRIRMRFYRNTWVNMGILQASASLESAELAKRDSLGPGPGGPG